MSGVVIKMGIYGLVRVTRPDRASAARLGRRARSRSGAVAALLGVRLRARASTTSSGCSPTTAIENIGIILIGLGPGAARPRRAAAPTGSRSASPAACSTSGTTRSSRRCSSSAPASVRPRDRHARARAAGRPAAAHARDGRALPRRRGRDLRPAAAQRLRQRVARLPRPRRGAAVAPAPPGRALAAPRARRWPARSPWPASSRSSAIVFLGTPRARAAAGRRTKRRAADAARRWPLLAAACVAARRRSRRWSLPPSIAPPRSGPARAARRPPLARARAVRLGQRRRARAASPLVGAARRSRLRPSAGARGSASRRADLGLRLRRAPTPRMQYTALLVRRARHRALRLARCGPHVRACPSLERPLPGAPSRFRLARRRHRPRRAPCACEPALAAAGEPLRASARCSRAARTLYLLYILAVLVAAARLGRRCGAR